MSMGGVCRNTPSVLEARVEGLRKIQKVDGFTDAFAKHLPTCAECKHEIFTQSHVLDHMFLVDFLDALKNIR
jgi:hypothetical protein